METGDSEKKSTPAGKSETYNGWEFNRPEGLPQHIGKMSLTDGVPVVRAAPPELPPEPPRRANFGSIQRFVEDRPEELGSLGHPFEGSVWSPVEEEEEDDDEDR